MNRADFEALRDMPGKIIEQDIRFSRRKALTPVMIADEVVVENAYGTELRLSLHFNTETGSKTINAYIQGAGPICRLDVDGTRHKDKGRSHKHALQSERCPDRNLPDDVTAREDLSGKGMTEIFEEFCRIASIDFRGVFIPPQEDAQ
jgi:hypothetical protein